MSIIDGGLQNLSWKFRSFPMKLGNFSFEIEYIIVGIEIFSLELLELRLELGKI